MASTFEEIKEETFGQRASFSYKEVEASHGFLRLMQDAGHTYEMHPLVRDDVEAYANEGYIIFHTARPDIAFIFVKINAGRGITGKKFQYLMFVDEGSDLKQIKMRFTYKRFSWNLPEVAKIRDSFKQQ